MSFKKPGSKKNQNADGVCFFSLTTKEIIDVDNVIMFVKDKYHADIVDWLIVENLILILN